MPEGYTHLRTARRAAETLNLTLAYPAAFAAGANGPDALFCFQVWKKRKNRLYDLPGLGARMHEEATGKFLMALAEGITTRAQLEYTLGFFSHYALDTVLHPYVAAVCAKGRPYGRKGGHGYFESALDSHLHEADTGDACVPAVDSSPLMVGPALAEVCTQLHTALLAAYGEDVPMEYLADAFYQITRLRGWFTSRHGFRKALYWLIEPVFGGRGAVTGHVTPRRLAKNLPENWQNPFTGQPARGDAFALLREGQKRSEVFMAGLLGWRAGKLSRGHLARLLGSMSYTQGIPTEASNPPPDTTPVAGQAAAPSTKK